MDKQYKILILEDKATDAELETEVLKNAGINFTSQVVSTKEDFEREVVAFAPDLIILDYALEGYSGIQAIVYIQNQGIKIPFIMITGILPKDSGSSLLEHYGAVDFIMKNELEKLPAAVKKALAIT